MPNIEVIAGVSNGIPIGANAFTDIIAGGNVAAAAGGYQAENGFDAGTGRGSPLRKQTARRAIDDRATPRTRPLEGNQP